MTDKTFVFNKALLVINPKAGSVDADTTIIRSIFDKYGINYEIAQTQHEGHGTELAAEASGNGFDAVIAYGGDGTLREVVNGLPGHELPLGILPGGTGNGLARDLKVPMSIKAAAKRICEKPTLRYVDVGRIGETYFILHAIAGIQPSQWVDDELKSRLGFLAYGVTALKVLADHPIVTYELVIDGEHIECEGTVCLLLNSTGIGISPGLLSNVSPDNGQLTVLILKRDIATLTSDILSLKIPQELFSQWQGREIVVKAKPSQPIWVDGDRMGETPITTTAVSQHLAIIS